MNKEIEKALTEQRAIRVILTKWNSHGDISASGVWLEIESKDDEKGYCTRWEDVTGDDFGIDSRYAGHRGNYNNIRNWLTRKGYKFDSLEMTTGWG